MRICYIFTNFHLLDVTGQPGIIYRLAKHVAKKEDVFILSNSRIESVLQRDGLNIFLIKGQGDFRAYFINLFKVIRYLKNIKPDIIHVHGYLLTAVFFFISKFSHAEFVCSVCETPEVVENILYRKAVFLCLKLVKKIFVTCEYIKVKLMEKGIVAERIIVSRFGLDVKFLIDRLPVAENHDILYFGDSTKERGFNIILDSANRMPELKFLVLLRWQGGNCQQELKIMKGMLNVSIFYYPYVESLEEFIIQSKLVILPYQWMGVRPPLSLIESMALGKCVITSCMEGNFEIIRNGYNGFAIDFTKLEKFIPIFYSLIKDKKLREKIGATAKRSIKELYALSELDKFMTIYKCSQL